MTKDLPRTTARGRSQPNRLLVANRGEIALRIFRACRDLGIETVAVFSDADRSAPHVAAADYAVRLGSAAVGESYLAIPRILDAAQKTRANLIHPGYGFLAENAEFARGCERAGFVFVGPPSSAIDAMGSKTRSRQRMREAGVPVVPGMMEAAKDAAQVRSFASESGYPILLKASAGGGGKGMRRVESVRDLESAFERVSAEASAFFGDAAVYAEKLIERPRHVEVQILGDRAGNIFAIGERECSVQRRHQKVVEECPSPVVDGPLRESLCAAAVAAARAVGYFSCGTVEFLLAPDGAFYFLEMNTRLQVEHAVTEEVWGVDLVTEMIRVALGEPLRIDPARLSPRGHAIECRIYAEDPRRSFAPAPGRVESLRLPQGPGVRNDIGVEAGSVVSIDYDPMVGKLIVWGPDRSTAIARLDRALSEYEISGIETTLPLFRALVNDGEFRRADFDAQWLDRRLAANFLGDPEPASNEVLLGAVWLAESSSQPLSDNSTEGSLWRRAARRDGLRGL